MSEERRVPLDAPRLSARPAEEADAAHDVALGRLLTLDEPLNRHWQQAVTLIPSLVTSEARRLDEPQESLSRHVGEPTTGAEG